MTCRLGQFAFPSKTAATAAVQRIYNNTPLGQILTGSDAALIAAVFARYLLCHPEADPLADPDFTVRTISRDGKLQRSFFALRPNGTGYRFGYRKPLGLAPQHGDLLKATRRAIAPDIIQYKTSRFGSRDAIPCDETGEPVAFADAHVDHHEPWPFAKILQAYLARHGHPELVRDPAQRLVLSAHDAASFRRFHNERARLRLVHRDVNLGRRRPVLA